LCKNVFLNSNSKRKPLKSWPKKRRKRRKKNWRRLKKIRILIKINRCNKSKIRTRLGIVLKVKKKHALNALF